MTIERSWYLSENGLKKDGPFTHEAIIHKIENGLIGTVHLVWSEGLSDWTEAINIPEFQSHFESRLSKTPPSLLAKSRKAFFTGKWVEIQSGKPLEFTNSGECIWSNDIYACEWNYAEKIMTLNNNDKQRVYFKLEIIDDDSIEIEDISKSLKYISSDEIDFDSSEKTIKFFKFKRYFISQENIILSDTEKKPPEPNRYFDEYDSRIPKVTLDHLFVIVSGLDEKDKELLKKQLSTNLESQLGLNEKQSPQEKNIFNSHKANESNPDSTKNINEYDKEITQCIRQIISSITIKAKYSNPNINIINSSLTSEYGIPGPTIHIVFVFIIIIIFLICAISLVNGSK